MGEPEIHHPRTGSLRCIRCGYDLRGLDAAGTCPECGLGVALTVAAGTHLQMGRPEWLGKVRLGVWLLVLLIPAVLVVGWLEAYLLAWTRQTTECWTGPFGVAGLHVLAIMLITSREHRFEKQMKGNRLRVALRVSVIGSMVIACCVTISILKDGESPWPQVSLFSFLLLVPTYAMSCLYLRTLARRVGNASLAEHCGIVAAGVSISILSPYIIAWIQPDKSVWPVLIMLTCMILFWIWSTYLFIRLASVMHSMRREARLNWRAADASLNA